METDSMSATTSAISSELEYRKNKPIQGRRSMDQSLVGWDQNTPQLPLGRKALDMRVLVYAY
jgi:hypothetical protein